MNLLKRFAVASTLIAAAGCTFAAPVTNQGTWETTLQARDINGNAVGLNSSSAAFFYDTTLNITWLANMNKNGAMNWNAAMDWAAGLTFGGFDDWRLPTVAGGELGYNPATQVNGVYNEWAHLFSVTLGNSDSLTNTAYFHNMQTWDYWTGTESSRNASAAWYFSTLDGWQGDDFKSQGLYAVAVRSGDVLRNAGTVPEPQSLALVMTALVGLGAAYRRRRAA